MSDMKVLMENWRGYQEEIITEDTWGELKKVLDTVLLAKKGSEVAGIASRLLGGNAIVDFIRAAGGIKGLIKNVGKLPDQKTDKFPFLDMFNVDDEYSKLIDDRVENTLLNRLSDLISKQSPNEQIPAGWNINDWLENELKTIMGDAEAIMHEDRALVTWRQGKPRKHFDKKGLGQEQPDLLEKYTKEMPGNRTFLVK